MPLLSSSSPIRPTLTSDGWLLFSTRFVRLFAYGLLSVVFVLYLSGLGLSDWQIGLLLTLTLVGDTAISLWLTTTADRVGRRRMLLVGSSLMVLAGLVFAVTGNFWLLLLAAVVGVISPSGGEVGPFLAIEQASLSQIVPGPRRTDVFAWYNLVGSVAMALGSLCGGLAAQLAAEAGMAGPDAYRPVVIAYGALGVLLAVMFFFLSPVTEAGPVVPVNGPDAPARSLLGLHQSKGVVFRLAFLFGLDAFGGGFVMQSLLAYWLHVRFGTDPASLGAVFLGANLLAGVSALAAGWLASRFGLVNTMVFTHLPSNVLLILVPLMPSLPWAVGLLLLRFSISQMDVPTRQAYTVAVVRPEERSAAAGVTGVARSVGASLSPVLSAWMMGVPALASLPFFLAGGIKVVYDLLLFGAFASVAPVEAVPETGRSSG
jgi:MFS family permease